MDTQDTAQPTPSGPDTSADVAANSVTAAAAPDRSQRLYPDDQPAASEAPPKQQGAPEAKAPAEEKPAGQEYSLQMPEGIQLDRDLLNAAAPVMREAGISVDQANKLVPLVTQVQERFQQSQLDQLLVVQADWARETKSDPQLGGKNLPETVRLVGRALEAGGAAAKNHEVRELLNESGLGNHPAFVRLFRNLGAEIERLRGKEGNPVRESTREAETRRWQQSVYPNDPAKRDGVSWEERSGNGKSRSERAYPDDQPKR